jgi:hypothetical protein
MAKQAGARGERYDPRTGSWVPTDFTAKKVSSSMRGLGCYEAGTVKDGFWRRQIDKLI